MTHVKVIYFAVGDAKIGSERGINEFTIKDKKGVTQLMNTKKILKKIKKQKGHSDLFCYVFFAEDEEYTNSGLIINK